MMRSIKNLLVFFFATALIISCGEDDKVSYVLQDVSAPTNLGAIFDIAQDDSGQVTLTPTGVGASVFEVFFGDVDNETPTEVNPGETVTHTYTEGEYTLRVVAIGLTGLKSELSRVVVISFTPPTELAIDVAISETNPFEITVTPTAVNATVFDILYGDEEEGATPTTIMSGETATHMYAEEGEYTITVVARGAGSATIQATETITIAGSAAPIVLPITFDDAAVNYAFGTFNGASYEVVDNPDLAGTNTEASKVGAITNSGNQFEGGAFNLGTPVDFSGANKTITMKFWATSAVPILLKFEGGVNGDERQNEVVANHGGTGWEDLSFNFATEATKSFIDGNQGVGEPFVPDGQYATMVIFVDGPGTTAGTFYIDDIAQTEATTSPLELPISFDAADVVYEFGTFNGASYEVVDNPDESGANAVASKVGAITNSGNQFEGGVFALDTPVDFSTDKTITMKLWATTSVPILLKFEGGVNGERQNEVVATHNGTGWEDLNFDFATNATKSFIDGSQGVGEPFVPEGEYASLVIFVDGPGTTAGTFYVDDITQVAGGGGATGGKTSFPVDFETPETGGESTFNVFENDDNPALEVIANPDATGANTSANVAQFTARVAGQPFAGTETPLETPFTLDATNSTVKILVWKSVISDVGIKFANAAGGSTGEIKVPNTLTNQWEELTFDFSGVIGDPNNTDIEFLVIFPDFNARTADTVSYFDNITLSASGDGGSTAPTIAAPTPMQAAADVISMFSNAYTDVTVDTWRTTWSDATLEDIQVAGDDVKKYSSLSFVGIETVASMIDASSMTHFRTDVWTADATELKVKLVDFGADGAFGGTDDVEHEIVVPMPAQGEWVSLDIPLSDFTGLTTRANISQLIYSGAPSQNNTVFVDNVYFYVDGSATPPTVPTMAAPTPSLAAANVISMFSDAYTDVPVDTWRTPWSSGTLEDIMVAGNATKKYSVLDFVGIETVGSMIDATSMTHFHTDIWTADATEFKVKLVDFGADGAFGGGDDVEHEIVIPMPAQGEWVSLDIPLSDFTGLTTRANISQLIYVGAPTGGNTVYVDNVYFHN